MPRNKAIKLEIPTPCHEDWNVMTPLDSGRHCGLCQKTVIDFTTWSDRDIITFFSEQRGKVCGKFLSTQLKKELILPPQPKSKLYRLAIACSLTLVFAQIPQAHSMVKQQSEMISTENNEPGSGTEDKYKLTGKIVDREGRIVPHAAVTIHKYQEVVATIICNIDGSFSIELPAGPYEIHASLQNRLYGGTSLIVKGNCRIATDVVIEIHEPMLGMVFSPPPTIKGEVVGTPDPDAQNKQIKKMQKKKRK